MPKENLPEFTQRIVDHIGYSHAALDKAAEQLEAVATTEEKVAELIPACVQSLIANGRIDETEKAAAEEYLRHPVQAIQLITKLAGHQNAPEKARLGQTVQSGVKTASSMRESDRRFFERLNIPYTE